jgi:hypothetical protein
MPFLQLRSVMPSAWWLLVLPVRRGGMTESMTAASHWPVFTATGGFVMSLMFNLAVNGFHQPHRRCTQVPAALPLTGKHRQRVETAERSGRPASGWPEATDGGWP